ncbi:MAG TPA: LysM peptidoglycan-binding domain-containing protein, partial [Polyangiaceae bacterium]|nr:LysM peptidoglycan-binding domain-containing protein [Polyangiaceae bacterium]
TSPAGAAGLWQFMATSARGYGLTVDRWVDERRDPMRATTAAVALLSDLYQRFGNWELAMAAYNMGYAGLARAITKFNTNDYWALARLEGGIPWETTLYVPKIFALAIVMNNREAFGLGRIPLDPPISFDTVLVEPATDISALARDAKLDKQALLDLNPALLADRLPPASGAEPRTFSLRVPTGRGGDAHRALSAGGPKHEAVTVRRGDDLSTLCADYGSTEAEWTRLNRLTPGERLEVGTLLLLPAGARREPRVGELPTFVVSRVLRPGPGERHVFYEVKAQDELEQIAAALGVSARELSSWNSLDLEARLREGMTLQALVDRERDLGRIRVREARGAQLLVAGSPEFHEFFEAQRGMRRVQVVVRAGDTLSNVGQRYGMTVGSMERINRRARTTPLVPGEILIVYTNRPGGSNVDAGAAELDEPVAPRPDLLPAVADGSH